MKRLREVLVILLVTVILFSLGAWYLIEKEVVQFTWSSKILKEREYKHAINSDRKVLVLGDSQLERWGFQHCLFKDMAKYFNEKEIGYLNASHYGFGPIEYEAQLKEALKYYTPDILLLFYYAGNDLGDVSYRIDSKPLERTYPVIFEQSALEKALETERKNKEKSDVKLEDQFDWALFKEQGMDDEIIELAKKRIKHPNDLGFPYVNPHLLNLGSYKPNNLYENCTLEAPGSKYGWYKSLQHFESIMAMADSIKAKVGLIVIPSNVQVDTSHYSFYRRAKFRVSDDLLFANGPQKVLYDFSKASQIQYLDLLPYFKSCKWHEDLYIINDDHLSEQGHELAFDVLRDQILDKLVIDTTEEMRNREIGFFKNFQSSVVQNQMDLIKSDSVWFNDVIIKANSNKITVERQLYLDAIYIIANFKNE